jgi:uncharacterized protein (DUF58 family)
MFIKQNKSSVFSIYPKGYLFLGIVLLVGFFATLSANDFLYFCISILLGIFLCSSYFSELAIRSVKVNVRQDQAIAGLPAEDYVEIQNTSRIPLYQMSLYEKRGPEIVKIADIGSLRSKEQRLLRSSQIYPNRGQVKWDTFGVATIMPFGFIQKMLWIGGGGVRVVWPSRSSNKAEASSKHLRSGLQEKDASVEDFRLRRKTEEDDWRRVAWALSAKFEEPILRIHQGEDDRNTFYLDLRDLKEASLLEQRIEEIAHQIYDAAGFDLDGRERRADLQIRLIVRDQLKTLEYSSTEESLTGLSVVGL